MVFIGFRYVSQMPSRNTFYQFWVRKACPKSPQVASRCAQRLPKHAPNVPKSCQGPSQDPRSGPKHIELGPKTPKSFPKACKATPNAAKGGSEMNKNHDNHPGQQANQPSMLQPLILSAHRPASLTRLEASEPRPASLSILEASEPASLVIFKTSEPRAQRGRRQRR